MAILTLSWQNATIITRPDMVVPAYILFNKNKSCYSFDDTAELAMGIITTIFSFLSIFCGLFILASYMVVPEVQNTARKLLNFVTINDVLLSLVNLTSSLRYWYEITVKIPVYSADKKSPACRSIIDIKLSHACRVLGPLTSYFTEASLLWTVAISIYFYFCCVKGYMVNYRKMVIAMHIVCWTLPLIVSVGGIVDDVYGSDMTLATGPWCWIGSNQPTPKRIAWMITSILVWEVFAYLSTIVIYMILKYRLWQKMTTGEQLWKRSSITGETIREADENFIFFPLILLVTRIWNTIRTILACVRLNDVHYNLPFGVDAALLLLQCFGYNGQAVFNFIVFCLCDKDVRTKLCQSRKEKLYGQDLLPKPAKLLDSVKYKRYSNDGSITIGEEAKLSNEGFTDDIKEPILTRKVRVKEASTQIPGPFLAERFRQNEQDNRQPLHRIINSSENERTNMTI